MITIRPFRALHYRQSAIGDLGAVLAPPYDVISAEQLERLYERSPYNAVRLTLSREADRYAAAARDLAAWRSAGVLVRDPEPCFYYYAQDFAMPDGSARQRAGLMAAVRLEPFAAGNIRPHERTFPAPKADRLRLFEACRANLSPVFGVYTGRLDALAAAGALAESAPPWIDARDDSGGRHRVWRVADRAQIEHIQDALRDATVFIADGHHRYETALDYRDRRRAEGDDDRQAPHSYLLMYLCPLQDPNLVILPTHRVWRGPLDSGAAWLTSLGEHFEIDDVPGSAGEGGLRARLEAEKGRGALGLRLREPDRCCVLRLRDGRALEKALADTDPVVRDLDVTILEDFVLGRLLGVDCRQAVQDGLLTYTHDDVEAVRAVSGGQAAAAFLVRKPRTGEVEAVCMAGQTMPGKSTYFYPKLQSGLVFRLLDEDD